MSLYNDLNEVLTPYANKIKEVNESLGDLADTIIGETTKDIIVPLTLESNKYYTRTGIKDTYSGCKASDYIDITKYLGIKVSLYVFDNIGGVCCYDANKDFISCPVQGGTFTDEPVDFPSGCVYVTLSSSGSDPVLKATVYGTIKDDVEQYGERIDDISDDFQELSTEVTGASNRMAGMNELLYEYDFVDITNDLEFIEGKYRRYGDGSIMPLNNARYCDIPVLPGDRFIVTARTAGGLSKVIILLDDEYGVVDYVTGNLTAYSLVIPEGCSYFSYAPYENEGTLLKYKEVTSIHDVALQNKENISALTPKAYSPLYGKILSITGDSEAKGHTLNTSQTYSALIAERNGMIYENYAVNGRQLRSEHGTNPIIDTYQEIRSDSDYILIHIGYNDGFESDVDDDSTDKTTYKGAFNELMNGLQTNYPNAIVGIIVPYYFDVATITAKAAWMLERAKKFNVQCIDLKNICGMNYNNLTHRALYFIDQVHLSAAGHAKMSTCVESFLRGL